MNAGEKIEKEANEENMRKKGKEKEEVDQPSVKEFTPTIPYFAQLQKDRMHAQFGKFLELFKKLHINIPFVEDCHRCQSMQDF